MELLVDRFLAKDIMVPLSEYATVSQDASIIETVLTLEKAQEAYTDNRYSHRAVLVLDNQGKVIGKFSQLHFLRLLEYKNDAIGQINGIEKFGFDQKTIIALREKYRQNSVSLMEIFSQAAHLKVADFMQTPTEGEYIQENASLKSAIHQLVFGRHLSLLVLKGETITGILRLPDVFAAIFHELKKSQMIKP